MAVPSDPVPTVPKLQIIICALAMGVLIFAGIAVQSKGLPVLNPAPPLTVFSGMALGMAGMMLLVRAVFPAQMVTIALRQLPANAEPQDLLGVFQTSSIVAGALPEGAAMFNGVAYIVDGHWANLVAMFVLVGFILALFPTHGGFETWAKHQLETAEFERGRSE